MPEPVTPETTVWNVEPQGQYNPWSVSKFHLDRGNTSAVCSDRTLLNFTIKGRAIGIGGSVVESSYGDGAARLGDLSRDQVCRRCVPVLPTHSTEPESGA